MEKDEEERRLKLNYHILYNIHPALGAFPPEEPPLLGDDFADSSQRFFEGVAAFRKRAVKHLSALPLETLETGFSRFGEPLTEEQQTWCLGQQRDFRVRFNWATKWHLALLDKDRTFAKYDHWAKAAYLSPEEALWLSVGLEPLPEFKLALDQRTSSTGRDAVVDHMVGLRNLLRRKFGSERKLTAKSVVDWANSVGHALHPGFVRMVESMSGRTPTSTEPVPAPETSVRAEKIDPREKQSMATLILAMAMDCYGYVPHAKRSPIPGEIESIVLKYGLNITQNTIRTYLRMGEELLPKDGLPEDQTISSRNRSKKK